MELNIKVCTNNSCKVIVNDITSIGDQGYLPENSNVTVKNRFRYSDTYSIDVLRLNKTTGPIVENQVITEHGDSPKDIELDIKFDGWFTVYHVVIPTIDWFNAELDKSSGSALNLYNTVYYTNGQDIFKYIDGHSEYVDINELLEINAEGTTISITSKEYVSVCFLRKCFINLCQQIFRTKGLWGDGTGAAKSRCCPNKDAVDSDLIFRRDLVWSALNVIKYMTEFNQLAEAERIIEQIGGCNGLCKSEFRQMSQHGCGCSKA